MLGAVLVAVAPARASQLAETVVRVYPTAVVNADKVLLADIADLSGEGVELAGGWAITAAPAPGQDTILEINSVKQALIRRGINPSNWVFRGSTRCRITRPMPVRSAEPQDEHLHKTQTTPLEGLQAMLASPPASTQPAGPDPDTLEGAIDQHLTDRLAALGGRPSIRLSPAVRDLLQLSRSDYHFNIAAKTDRLLGLVPLEVSIYRQQKLEKTVSVLAEVSLAKAVVVSAGTINRGQTVASNDVTLKEMTFDRPDRLGLDDIRTVVGQRALRFINKNEMIVGKDIEPLPLINRNDLVTVTARRGQVAIKGVAKALGSGGYGDLVELRNESSRQTFVAVITGAKTAELTRGPAATADALSMAGGKD